MSLSAGGYGQNMLPVAATITGIDRLTDKDCVFSIRLSKGGILRFRASQFVILSLFGIGEAPISISSSPLDSEKSFELCIRVVGNLTRAVHRLSVGDKVGIRGPYGNGFPMERIEGRDVVIVAGGLGLAPLRSLIRHVIHERDRYGRVIVLIGAKRPQDILFKEDILLWEANPSIEVHLTVDVAVPPWDKHVGVITKLFRYVDVDSLNAVAAVVGPPIMYRFVVSEILNKGLFEGNIYLSLERRMRCGIGKCGHCQINGIYLCQDGPVLSYMEARKLKEAL